MTMTFVERLEQAILLEMDAIRIEQDRYGDGIRPRTWDEMGCQNEATHALSEVSPAVAARIQRMDAAGLGRLANACRSARGMGAAV